ncbi:MAG: hypothetical protein CVU38_03730 [Chloroflexi bacterium HGW-Chloroflexi-1]|nr:MAG: hypothetical protein CVU38_03730 [Chloroflexi bacterium HGW-Chloroflexi-1]
MLPRFQSRVVFGVVGRYGLIALLSVLLLVMIYQNRLLIRTVNSLRRAPSAVPMLQMGQEAPLFVLPSTTSDYVELADYRGKGVLLIFFDQTCEACKLDSALWQIIDQKTIQTGISVPGVTHGDTNEIRAFVQETRLQFPILLDEDYKVMQDYLVYEIPCKVLLDSELQVAHIWVGLTNQYSSPEDLYELKRHWGVLPSQLSIPEGLPE